MTPSITINGRRIGAGEPVYIVAELSANHNQDIDEAIAIMRAAKEAGADAIKLQTYTPDTMTIRSDKPYFRIGGGTLWDGQTLHDLYGQAYTPWDWFPRLQREAADLGLDFFSTPFDPTSLAFLERLDVPVHKVASFELVDLPLIDRMARTGKPLIISTGMASLDEIREAVDTVRAAGGEEFVLLKCCSAYPAPPEGMHLKSIPYLAETFGVPAGLSDHTLGTAVPVAAVALGACLIEKHLTRSRAVAGPDSAFSLEPHEFRAMVEAVRTTEKALGGVSFGEDPHEAKSRAFRRSLFVVKDIRAGERLTDENVRSIRPSHGLPPKHLTEVLGRVATRDIEAGTPLSWELLAAGAVTEQV